LEAYNPTNAESVVVALVRALISGDEATIKQLFPERTFTGSIRNLVEAYDLMSDVKEDNLLIVNAENNIWHIRNMLEGVPDARLGRNLYDSRQNLYREHYLTVKVGKRGNQFLVATIGDETKSDSPRPMSIAIDTKAQDEQMKRSVAKLWEISGLRGSNNNSPSDSTVSETKMVTQQINGYSVSYPSNWTGKQSSDNQYIINNSDASQGVILKLGSLAEIQKLNPQVKTFKDLGTSSFTSDNVTVNVTNVSDSAITYAPAQISGYSITTKIFNKGARLLTVRYFSKTGQISAQQEAVIDSIKFN
jgi:hypothetical protein